MDLTVYYAEHELEVHRVHTETQASKARLDGIQRDIATARDSKRRLEVRLEDVELDVLTEERGKHASQSATWLKEHVKGTVRKNEAWIRTRDEILTITNRIERLEYERSSAQRDIEIGVARMVELGGYFQYLSAIKMAESARASA